MRLLLACVEAVPVPIDFSFSRFIPRLCMQSQVVRDAAHRAIIAKSRSCLRQMLDEATSWLGQGL